jgi:predicted transcriptional regulator
MTMNRTDTILLSIHPKHVENILSGKKYFEYRKKIPTDISCIVIYSTAPVKRVVAVAEVENIISDSPSRLWERTKEGAGITQAFFEQYFQGRTLGNAIKLGRVTPLPSALSLNDDQLKMTPPQSYAFLTAEHLSAVLA